MNEKPKSTSFLRERFLSIFDNLFASLVLYALGLALPILIGFLLKLEIQVTFLTVLLISQIFIFSLLFSIRNRLPGRKQKPHLLVRDANSKETYLIDRFGLSRFIKDEDTVQYLTEMFGYLPDEVPEVAPSELIPPGPEVTALRRWRPPRTIEDEMSAKARSSIKLLKKYVRSEDRVKILSFDLSNGDEVIQINSAKLVFEGDAPLALADISPKNSPMYTGYLHCKLLFNGESESKRLLPQEECRLDLILKRNLTAEDTAVITSSRFGYIDVRGVFRDTNIKFHLSV